MADVIIRTVEDNTAPNRQITLEHNGSAINLTGATVVLIISNAQTGVVTNTGSACTIITAADGIVEYALAAADYPDEGRYFGEFKITYTGGKVERLESRLVIVARAKA